MLLNLCTSSYDDLYLVYICTKFHENILGGTRVIERTQFTYEEFQRAIISKKMLMELQFFFSAHCLMVICICTNFMKIFSTVLKLQSGHDFHWKKFKGA